MLKNFDHLTIVVRDIDRAKAFFRALGFKEASAFSTLAIAALMVRSARRARLERGADAQDEGPSVSNHG